MTLCSDDSGTDGMLAVATKKKKKSIDNEA